MSIKSYAAVIILLLVVAGTYLLLNSVAHTGTFLVELTDPPIVPAGTRALIVAYSGVALHSAGASNSTGFVSVQSSGILNLMNLTNITQTIAVLHARTNASFDSVRLNLTNANITVDNKTYNVTLLQKVLLVRLLNKTNSSTGGAVIDLMPVMLQIYTGNKTLFAMAPSLRAVAIGRKFINATSVRIGASQRIDNDTLNAIVRIRPNITITGASLYAAGNTTHLSVTVKNNIGKPADLKQLLIFGNFEALLNSSAFNAINADAMAGNITAEDIVSIAHSLNVNNITANTLNEVYTEITGRSSDPAISTSSLRLTDNYNSTYLNYTISTIENSISSGMPSSSIQQTFGTSAGMDLLVNTLLNSGGASIATNALGINLTPAETRQIIGVVSNFSALLKTRSANLSGSGAQQIFGTLLNISILSNALSTNATSSEKSQIFGTLLNMTINPNVSNSQISEVAGRLENLTLFEHVNATQALDVASNLNLTQNEVSATAKLLTHHRNIEAASMFRRDYYGMLDFIVATNGTLVLPLLVTSVERQAGYVLAGNSSATLVFNGVMTLGSPRSTAISAANALPLRLHVIVVPIQNSTYAVRVTGAEGAFAKASVTAG